jgi:hypothetical protein
VLATTGLATTGPITTGPVTAGLITTGPRLALGWSGQSRRLVAPRDPPGLRGFRRWHGHSQALKHPGLEAGRRLGRRQQLKQLLAGHHQLPHVLTADIAIV